MIYKYYIYEYIDSKITCINSEENNADENTWERCSNMIWIYKYNI